MKRYLKKEESDVRSPNLSPSKKKNKGNIYITMNKININRYDKKNGFIRY